jgi:hypothetical protein
VVVYELPAANALLTTARRGAMMMGAALAGILVDGVGVGMKLLGGQLSLRLTFQRALIAASLGILAMRLAPLALAPLGLCLFAWRRALLSRRRYSSCW